MISVYAALVEAQTFQCSSASRKFLNRTGLCAVRGAISFQCSSASRKFLNSTNRVRSGRSSTGVSVLFSEPKIPQLIRSPGCSRSSRWVSVLFSEPKIPQLYHYTPEHPFCQGFSALQRAENSSIMWLHASASATRWFQCSSASRKFLNATGLRCGCPTGSFSALQRAENSSITHLSSMT